MKNKRVKQRYAVLFIPEANRPVQKMHMTAPVFYTVLMIIILAILMINLWPYLFAWKTSYESKQLDRELARQKQAYETMKMNKDGTIEQLQSDLVLLSQQTREIRQQLAELKQVEKELRILSGISDPENSDSSMAERKDGAVNYSMGGETAPLAQEAVDQLVRETSIAIQSASAEIKHLSVKMNDVKQLLEERQERLMATPTIWPTAGKTINSGYGFRLDPFTRRASFHSGVDIDGRTGSPVYATAKGTVETVEFDSQKGNYIVIDHSYGIETVYMHLQKTFVAPGDHVEKGQKIGSIGSTGRSTGPHLHYEVHKNGQPVDPQKYF